MPLYNYRAKNAPNKIVKGQIQAFSKEAAVRKVEEMGYFPIKVEEERGKGIAPGKISFKTVKAKHITIFTRQLSILIKSGVPLLRSLEIVSNQTQDRVFQLIINRVHSDIKEGKTFSSALSGYPNVFSSFYTSMVKAGEDSGTLNDVLARVADYREKRQEIISKVKIALAYPVVMLFVGLGTVIFMLTFVMPRLMNIFSDIGSELPLPTKIIISLSNILKEKWPILIIVAAFLIFIYMKQKNRKEVKTAFSIIKLHLPVIKNFILRKEISRFARTLELLLKSGIPILKALELTIFTLENEIIKREFSRSFKELEGGASLGASLRKSKVFPAFVVSLISVGEESGRLDGTLQEVADVYESELEESIKIMTTLLEPLMILVMGILVGFVVIAMLLPIFHINLMIK